MKNVLHGCAQPAPGAVSGTILADAGHIDFILIAVKKPAYKSSACLDG